MGARLARQELPDHVQSSYQHSTLISLQDLGSAYDDKSTIDYRRPLSQQILQIECMVMCKDFGSMDSPRFMWKKTSLGAFICSNKNSELFNKVCKIRTASKEDTEPIYKVHTDSIREICSSCYNEEDIGQWISRQHPSKYEAFIDNKAMRVAVLEDRVIAFGHLEQFTETVAEVCGLYVSPGVSRNGIGTLMLCALEDEAKANGYQGIRLKSSLNAQNFYVSNGYQITQQDFCHCAGDDNPLCAILMIKSLQD